MNQLQSDICTYLKAMNVPVIDCKITDTEIVINMSGVFSQFESNAYDFYYSFLRRVHSVIGFTYRDFYAINPTTKAMNPCASFTIHNEFTPSMTKEDLESYLSANFKRFILV